MVKKQNNKEITSPTLAMDIVAAIRDVYIPDHTTIQIETFDDGIKVSVLFDVEKSEDD